MSALENGHGNGYNKEVTTNSQDHNSGRPISRAVTPGGHAVDSSQPSFPVYHRKFANPAPLGLFGFATTTLVLSLINAGARGVTTPNIIIGLGLAYGGLAQFMAGMWEFAAGNTFGATAFTSYGAFWISFSIIFIPFFNVAGAYEAAELDNAIGHYLVGWTIVTFLFLLGTLKSSVALCSVFFVLTITFGVLVGAFYTSSHTCTVAGGWLGIITAVLAYYTALTGLLDSSSSYFVVPGISLARNN